MRAEPGVDIRTGSVAANLDRWLSLLRCVECMSALRSAARGETLACTSCGRRVAVVNGVPRFTTAIDDPLARRTQASFSYEWTHFDDWRASGETSFSDYFADIDLSSLRDVTVLDAGCGMARHARQLAPFVGRLVAADFSAAIDVAAKHTAALNNVLCIQTDLMRLPVPDSSFDFVYSFGVVHHLADTEAAVRALASKLRPGGRLRLYVYWKRRGWIGRTLTVVNLIRGVTTRTPFPLLRSFCWALSVALFWIVIVPYRVLGRLGVPVSDRWPLFVYTKYPFRILYNDQFDRFSAPLEKRYTAEEARRLAESAGLHDVRVQPRFGWIVDGFK